MLYKIIIVIQSLLFSFGLYLFIKGVIKDIDTEASLGAILIAISLIGIGLFIKCKKHNQIQNQVSNIKPRDDFDPIEPV